MNLLPRKQKKRLKLEMIYRNIVYSGLILILLVLVLIFFSGAFLFFLNFKYHNIEKNIMEKQSRVIESETVRGMERKVKELNKELENLKEIKAKQSNLYVILDNINNDILKDVELYTLEIDKDLKKVTITGFASDRNILVNIKEILEQKYKNIDFPISNFTKAQNIDFTFSFIYE